MPFLGSQRPGLLTFKTTRRRPPYIPAMPARHVLGSAVRRTGLAAGFLLTFAGHVRAQNAATPPWTEFVVQSSTIGKRTIRVATPAEYARGSERYPVLVMLDAEGQPMLRPVIAQAAYLAANGDGVPPLIVVGIVNGPDRIHDMTPPPTGSSVAAFKTAGGASAFADFVLGDVLPTVRARYRTLPTAVLAGQSAGGLFALDVAASRPGSFHGIVAMDPAIWFNDGAPARLYADAIARSPSGTRVFAGYGGLESDIDAATTEFAQRLKAAKSSTVGFASRPYEDDSHALVPLSALPDGLRFVFAPISLRGLPVARLPGGADSAEVMAALHVRVTVRRCGPLTASPRSVARDRRGARGALRHEHAEER
jgi:predicted alpha/beta superfamily hydrolase